jgi:hypothetical protein
MTPYGMITLLIEATVEKSWKLTIESTRSHILQPFREIEHIRNDPDQWAENGIGIRF